MINFKNKANEVLLAIGHPRYDGITSVEIEDEELYGCDTYTLQCFYEFLVKECKNYGLSYTVTSIGQTERENIIVIDRIKKGID